MGEISLGLLWGVAFCGAVSAGPDCVADPEADYDLLSDSEVVMAVARVTSMAVSGDDLQGCLTVGYAPETLLSGALAQAPEVMNCIEGLSLEELRAGLATAEMRAAGFEMGAEVLVGLVDAGEGVLRYVVPNCLGPLHMRLDGLTEAQRDGVLLTMRKAASGGEN